MQVILRENISSLGQMGDLVTVADGYARNYLLPKKMAYVATEANKKKLESERKVLEAKHAKQREAATAVKDKIEQLSLSIAKQVGEEEKLFGSVTASDVEKALSDEGVTVDRKMITFADAIKTVGEHSVDVHIYADVVAKCKITVVAE